MFKVKAIFNDIEIVIMWNKGKLFSADEDLILHLHSRNLLGLSVDGPIPMEFEGNKLKDSLAAYFFLKAELGELEFIEGEVPTTHSPPGAIN